MDITQLVVQVVVAIVCAGVANILVPRRIPGKLFGLVMIGLLGVWVGQWGFALMRQRLGIAFPFLTWDIEGVLIIPAIIGSAIVLYLVTLFLKMGHFE
ncbi:MULTISPECIES: hypothetical protein [unclassified Leptolyngbya]|uniref:hypothetical protein n=1 Tax=unclassified Leptolyngbya TaxID=2650499 RepID=UPI00168218B3|nr:MULTISPECIES: hypothetical protein [unclassified Leptolyngbya]MBD1910567.1 hypothetical protein [Leptolyngbya sp. FACHB-8]MBD2153938.1 hypothetical protein [Leptolyngbya sp. FACHB-16]